MSHENENYSTVSTYENSNENSEDDYLVNSTSRDEAEKPNSNKII
jgi:hypothetical protein